MFTRLLLVVIAAGFTAGCADTWDVDAVRALANKGGAFNRELQKEYADLAEAEKAEFDWPDTRYFIKRAAAAANGEVVRPQPLCQRDIPAEAYEDLSAARVELVAALNAAAARKAPDLAARAQAGGFDCWMQEQEENRQPADINACRAVFDAAMTDLRARMAKPAAPRKDKKKRAALAPMKPFVVYFKSGSAAIGGDGGATLKGAAEAWKKQDGATVLISGYTDTVGSEFSNILLSQKRAEMTADALATLGVKLHFMALEAYGEGQQAVKTGDNVAEPLNRRVEIKVRKAN